MQTVFPDLVWRDGRLPVSRRFDDPYFSFENGFDETKHVFLDANKIPERFCDGFTIAELGFGTGLNFLTTLLEWRRFGTKGRFYFTSFEAYPIRKEDMMRALANFEILTPFAEELGKKWNLLLQQGYLVMPDVTLTLIIGDARKTVPFWRSYADCWYLDGFSPIKNPELWGAALLEQVYRHTKVGGTASTYTAAGFVRKNLKQAGFCVERTSGYARKRHMTIAKKNANHAK